MSLLFRLYEKETKLDTKDKSLHGKYVWILGFISFFLLGLLCGAYIYQPQNTGRLSQVADPAAILLPAQTEATSAENEKVYPTYEEIRQDIQYQEIPTPPSDDPIADIIAQQADNNNDDGVSDEQNSETPQIDHPKVILQHLEIDIPIMAIVIDDMGINQKRTKDILSLKAPLTSSFLTYGKNLQTLADAAVDAGHEIMIHAPMEPKVSANLAPDTLKVDMSGDQIEDLFNSMLNKFQNIKVSGINNHMGSKFTENKDKLRYIMRLLKEKNMFFLDSKTTSASMGKELALEDGIDFVERDVFLDNQNEYDAILKQLQRAEKIAIKKGYAVAICHPKSQTFAVLKDWLKKYDEKQIRLVHLSEIVQQINLK